MHRTTELCARTKRLKNMKTMQYNNLSASKSGFRKLVYADKHKNMPTLFMLS